MRNMLTATEELDTIKLYKMTPKDDTEYFWGKVDNLFKLNRGCWVCYCAM